MREFSPHQAQQKILLSNKRFIIVFAGRRFGKSVLAVTQCIERAILFPKSKIWYCSPLYKQTKEIAWNLFLEFCHPQNIAKKNESELKLTLHNGSEISLKGTDNPDSLVGVGLNFCVLDEFPLMEEEVWKKIVRPMLIDTKGDCLFIGTPRGFNWAYELWKSAEKDDDYDRFHFKTIDNTAVDEIGKEVEKARTEATSELDRVTFRQEYEASFEITTGRPRFDIEILNRLRINTLPTVSHGILSVLKHKRDDSKYIIGVDTSEGLITGDNSAAVILNARTFDVEAYYKGKIAPDIFATHLKTWAEDYNNALVVVESNNHGLTTINFLKDTYKNLYSKKVYDEISNTWTDKLGFQTNTRTKPLIINNLDKALRDGLGIYSTEILDELSSYIIEEDGKTNASEGQHDDLVIATALAVQGYLESSDYSIKEKEKEPEPGSVEFLLRQKKQERTNTHQYQGIKFRR